MLSEIKGKIEIIDRPSKNKTYTCKQCKHAIVASKGEICDYCLEDNYFQELEEDIAYWESFGEDTCEKTIF